MYHAQLGAIAPHDALARVGEDDSASDDAKARTIAYYLLGPSVDFKLAPDVALKDPKLRPRTQCFTAAFCREVVLLRKSLATLTSTSTRADAAYLR